MIEVRHRIVFYIKINKFKRGKCEMMVHDYFPSKAFDRTHAISIVFQCRGFYGVPFLISYCYFLFDDELFCGLTT